MLQTLRCKTETHIKDIADNTCEDISYYVYFSQLIQTV